MNQLGGAKGEKRSGRREASNHLAAFWAPARLARAARAGKATAETIAATEIMVARETTTARMVATETTTARKAIIAAPTTRKAIIAASFAGSYWF